MQPQYIDEDLLVLEKPAGLLSVPGKGPDKQDCLSARAHALWPGALVVHRLDQPTSGLVVMARNLAAQRTLSQAFAERLVGKTYTAVVHGRPDASAADAQGWSTIDLPIAADWPRRPLRVIDHANGKPATTRWRLATLQPASAHSRVILEPLTGRTHQLRVHLQALGHPIAGDALYGWADGLADGLADAPRLLLHASALRLAHPVSGAPMEFTSPVPF